MTMRQHLDDLLVLHSPYAAGVIDDWCPTCDGQYLQPCETFQRVEAMLVILAGSESRIDRRGERSRVVPDPVPEPTT